MLLGSDILLYNNKAVVANGVKDMKKLSQTIEAFQIHNNTKKDFDAKKYAIDEATRTYSTIVNKCIACHKIIRKW